MLLDCEWNWWLNVQLCLNCSWTCSKQFLNLNLSLAFWKKEIIIFFGNWRVLKKSWNFSELHVDAKYCQQDYWHIVHEISFHKTWWSPSWPALFSVHCPVWYSLSASIPVLHQYLWVGPGTDGYSSHVLWLPQQWDPGQPPGHRSHTRRLRLW